MNTIKVYFSILLIIRLFCDSSPQEVELHNIGAAIGQILGNLESLDNAKFCESNKICRISEKCIEDRCRDPCPGSCGINAICTVLEHEPKCRCPKCYQGDALIKCEPYKGLRRLTCQGSKLIERFNKRNSQLVQGETQKSKN